MALQLLVDSEISFEGKISDYISTFLFWAILTSIIQNGFPMGEKIEVKDGVIAAKK